MNISSTMVLSDHSLLRKANGKQNGNFRTIEAPSPILKRIQKYILHFILPVHRFRTEADKNQMSRMMPAATAFESGCSIQKNASPHCGKEAVVSLDVKNFFPSLRYHHVLELLKECVWDDSFAVMLAKFCTLNGHLPQGAITSPHISNLLLENFDISLSKFCLAHNMEFTRYADNLTFSGDPSNEEITELIRFSRMELKK